MSVQTQIDRLNTAKKDLKTAIEAKGVTVPAETTLDGYGALVAQIEAGGDAWTKVYRDDLPKTPPTSGGAVLAPPAGYYVYFTVALPAEKDGLEMAMTYGGGLRLFLIKPESEQMIAVSDSTMVSVYSHTDETLVLKINMAETTYLYCRLTTSPI